MGTIINRRDFLKRASVSAAGGIITASTLGTLTAHANWVKASQKNSGLKDFGKKKNPTGYGALKRQPDQYGEEILALPRGFQYVTFAKIGQMMSDGYPTPCNHDGMTCFEMPNGNLRLIRNHELRNSPGDFTHGVMGPKETRYDAQGMGGCVTLDFDPKHKQLLNSFISLNGTIVNCSGGLAYRDQAWLSCEESTRGRAQGFDQAHGYTFLVPRDAQTPVRAQPIKAMGRFAKEAAVADNRTGIIYQTEDARGNSGFYRFLPADPNKLLKGGVLQMLAIQERPNYDARTQQTIGLALPVRWVTIEEPDPAELSMNNSCFSQGFSQGGARFNRLEGVFRGEDDSIYFVSTDGGDAGYGQLWRYQPDSSGMGSLTLVFESPDGNVLDSPDNLCVTPSGGILFCEDDASNDTDTHPLAPGLRNINRLIGLSREGQPFEFAVNILNESEFAGACFSPDGEILFVNIFGDGRLASGMTCAIWGPWRRGPL